MRASFTRTLLALSPVFLAGGFELNADQPAEPWVDVAPFGQIMNWEPDGRDHGVMWEDARDVFRVVVTFHEDSDPPDPAALHLEYWHSKWPELRIPRDRPATGGGKTGWQEVGDWFNGKWQRADTQLKVKGHAFVYTFNPVMVREFPKLKQPLSADYRSTLKLRVVGEMRLPKVTGFQVFSDSTWRSLTLEAEWGGTAKAPQVWDGHLEIFNGRIEGVEPLAAGGRVQVATDGSWKSTVQGPTAGVRARILYAQPKGYNSYDETVVTVRAAQETFSFLVTDLVHTGRIFIPDLGALVRKAGDRAGYREVEQEWQQRRAQNRDLYSRVADLPEQTFTKAWSDTPAKQPHYIPISFEGGRQHFQLDENGDVVSSTIWIDRVKGKDTARCLWSGRALTHRFGLPEGLPSDRGLLEGYLPIMVTTWEKDGIRYRQTVLAVPMNGVPVAEQRIQADDTLVLMARIQMERIGDAEGEARLDLATAHRKRERLKLDRELALVAGEPNRVRMWLHSPDAAGDYSLAEADGQIAYRAALTTDRPVRTLDVAIPFITLTLPGALGSPPQDHPDAAEVRRLRALKFDEQLTAVRAYWHGRIAAGCQIDTPETMINDFYRADVTHLLINTEREVGGSDRYLPRVGSFRYGVYPNESCMMLIDLEVRGYPQLVERSLDTWLHYQGTVALPGDFSTADGVLFGAGGYQGTPYNQHHGWVLWMLGEHYWYTRDRAWLERAAPKIIQACDWVREQRRRTSELAEKTSIRSIERGLLPPGQLEDITDWRLWLSTNIYTWRGCQNAARALGAIGHPEAPRLLEEAASYHNDLLAAYTEALRRSPVVRLRDGSWIPKVPSDVHRRGRSFGWITETLEGAMHLVTVGAIEPNSRLATWIIRDYEDNLYLSEQFGYELKGEAFERLWFSWGGVSQQANLLPNPTAYLLRDEPKHFLRAYFNAFAVCYFADTRMMTECALPNIGDWLGDHFKSSDESNSTYWLRCMFVQERGDDLLLGYAVPRYWLADGRSIGVTNTHTYYGRMSMRMKSSVASGTIAMTIDPPKRNPPKLIRARFRHPEGAPMTGCEVNGQPYKKFDPQTESVELPVGTETINVTARYGP